MTNQVLARTRDSFRLTGHAAARMQTRGISERAVSAVLRWGRRVHARGATIYAIGRREVRRARSAGLDLSRFDGIQVVCSLDDAIVTVYRNRDFRGLRR